MTRESHHDPNWGGSRSRAGRVPKKLDIGKLLELRAQGLTWNEVASALGTSRATAVRRFLSLPADERVLSRQALMLARQAARTKGSLRDT